MEAALRNTSRRAAVADLERADDQYRQTVSLRFAAGAVADTSAGTLAG